MFERLPVNTSPPGPRRVMKTLLCWNREKWPFSGAAAFVEVWARLPRWRWAARAAALPGAMAALEFGYGTFLPVRPFSSWLFGKMQKLGSQA